LNIPVVIGALEGGGYYIKDTSSIYII